MAKIDKRLIWSGWLRLSHLLVGLAVLMLIGSGWLAANAPSLEGLVVDLHYYAASGLVFGLALRLVLMFVGSPIESIARLVPEDNEWGQVKDTLRFYLGFGKAPLPRWHAHNPLWKPIYLLLYLCLLIMVISGWLRIDSPVVGGIYLPSIHALFAGIVTWIAVLHVISVVLHDFRGEAADVSGIINGYRHFVIDTPEAAQVNKPMAEIRLDQIGGGKPPKDGPSA